MECRLTSRKKDVPQFKKFTCHAHPEAEKVPVVEEISSNRTPVMMVFEYR